MVVLLLPALVLKAPIAAALPDQRVAYAFAESAGTAVADGSGNNVSATATSPTWTTSGRYGRALTFNGTSTRVRSTTSLSLPSAFTFEAWVLNPSNASFETVVTVGSGRDLYLSNGVITFWNGTSDLTFGTLPTNAWAYLAVVSDGTNVRAYVNGAQSGATRASALAASSGPLQIGAWINSASNSDYFSGTVDEVRVYYRALSVSEITSDMSSPIGPSAPDTTPPVLSNGSPTGTLPAGTRTANLQVTTNENATCRYSTTAGTAFANMPTAFTTTGSTAHTSGLTGLADGTSYSYYVRCQDPAGNATTSDYPLGFAVAAPPPPDTTPPTVAITAPANAATVYGSVTVTATAADNVAVAGVQFLLDGSPLGTEDTTAPYSASWSTPGTVQGAHVLTARARDAAGNQTTSAAVTVTVQQPPIDPALVTAYALNETNGTAAGDASLVPNPATVTNGTWTTAGRFGGGLVFNGASSRVRSNANLVLPGAFTFEAWVLNPTNAAYESVMTVGNTRDLYLANGTIRFWSGSADYSFGTLPLNAWSHIAFVSSGSTIRVFRNGVAQGTTQNVSLAGVAAPLQIGAWINGSSNGDFFGGTIDETRVYSRALDQAEIQADMGSPISPATSDTTPPVVSNGLPLGTLAYGTTSANLQVTTNENATCRHSSTPGTAYSAMTGTFSTTGSSAHLTVVGGLADGATYAYYVRCSDAAGNANPADYGIAFSTSVSPGSNTYSMHFFGKGVGDIDRIKIPLTTDKTIDVGNSFTIEWWMRTDTGNASGDCVSASGAGWVSGNTLIDRDVYGNGDSGDYGISMFNGNGRIAFGAALGANGYTLCSVASVNDGGWHHVAVTRDGTSGLLAIFVDGVPSGSATGPSGDVSYRDGRATTFPNSDPYLVLGAEKHDAGSAYPSFRGWLDELRISNVVRYTAGFPLPLAQQATDATTVAIYHFEEGGGTVALDGKWSNNGVVQVGGSPVGPVWDVASRPF
jgi:hypothetical protein